MDGDNHRGGLGGSIVWEGKEEERGMKKVNQMNIPQTSQYACHMCVNILRGCHIIFLTTTKWQINGC